MQYAIIDFGSNTIRLCIYEIDDLESLEFRQIFNKKMMAGLASYLDENGNLSQDGINRAIEILQSFNRKIDNYSNIVDRRIFATAILRRAANSKDVIEQVFNRTGLNIDLLSGNDEARIGFIGAMHSVNLDTGVQMDIGGASAEIVHFENKKLIEATSLHLGSLSLFIKQVSEVIPTPREMDNIRLAVTEDLKRIQVLDGIKVSMATGVGGSIRAAEKIRNAWLDEGNRKIGKPVTLGEITQILDMVTYDYRGAMRSILRVVPERVHTAIPGIVAAQTIMKYVGANTIKISKYGVREGYLISKILGRGTQFTMIKDDAS